MRHYKYDLSPVVLQRHS